MVRFSPSAALEKRPYGEGGQERLRETKGGHRTGPEGRPRVKGPRGAQRGSTKDGPQGGAQGR